MATRLFSKSPRFLACTRYLVMVATPKQAFLARFLEFIQKPRGISLIAFFGSTYFRDVRQNTAAPFQKLLQHSL